MKSRYDFVRFMNEEEFEEWIFKMLVKSYKKARKGKRATVDEHNFELFAAENLKNLTEAVVSGFYEPGRGIAFVTYHPVPREIFAAPFKDRIIHHFLHGIACEFWEPRLIHDAYSCREGKGVLYGVQRAQHHIKSVSENYTRPAHIIKLDIQGYFMSLSREKLYARMLWGLEQQFPERGRLFDTCAMLWQKVIFDDPTDGVIRKGPLSNWDDLPPSKSLFCQPEGQGIVIGNLSSQLLSNIYLDLLDRYVMYDLGYRHYGRYVDDFFIVVPDEQYAQAKADVAKIREFLMSIGLTLHPKKVYMQDVKKGVTWLGVTIKPYGLLPGKRLKTFFWDAASKFLLDEGEVTSVTSYLGHMSHLKSTKFEKKLFDHFGWRYEI